MKWARRFALFNPRLPFLGKRSRDPQPEDETLQDNASTKRPKTEVKNSWVSFLGNVLWSREPKMVTCRHERVIEQSSEPEQEVATNVVRWLDGSGNEQNDMDVDMAENDGNGGGADEEGNDGAREAADEAMDVVEVKEEVELGSKNGSEFPFVDNKKASVEVEDTPVKRLVQHDYEHLKNLFEQDCRSSFGCAEEHRMPRPVLRHYSAKRVNDKRFLKRSMEEAVETAISRTAVRKLTKEASMAELGKRDSIKQQKPKKRSLPGPEKEKYRPGKKNKEAKTMELNPSELQTGQTSDLKARHQTQARVQKLLNGFLPTAQAVIEEKARSESLPGMSSSSWEPRRPLQSPKSQSARQPGKPVDNMCSWTLDNDNSTQNCRYMDLRSCYSLSTRSAKETFDEAAKLKAQAKQVAYQKSFPSMEELNNRQHGKNMSERYSKFQKSPPLKSPVLECKLFKSTQTDFLPTTVTPKDEDESSESKEIISESEVTSVSTEPPPESPTSDPDAESCVTEGKPFGVKVKGKDRRKLESIMARRDSQVMTEVDNVPFTRKMLACIGHGEWLNDEVMNGYMKLLQDRDTRYREIGNDSPKCHFHKTFFMNRLLLDSKNYNYKNVQRWTKPARLKNWGQQSPTILDCDIIFFPVHLGVHWTLVMALMKEKRIVYYDSLQGKRMDVLRAVCYYLKDEAMDKKGEEWCMLSWSLEFAHNIPRQTNGCDCGMFALMYAKSRAEIEGWDDDWGFAETDMPDLRVGVLKEFLAKSLL